MVIVKLREQLLAQERKLDEQENALMPREHGVVEAKHSLGRARMECDAALNRATGFKQDYHAQLRASTTSRWRPLEFDQVLSGHRLVLSLLETDLEHREK
jgi:hypothetical protein